MKRNEIMPKDTTKKTKPESKKKECNDTGNSKKWEKVCPVCKNIQTYKRKDVLDRAIKKNTRCHKCKIFSEEHRKKIGTKSASRKYDISVIEKRKITLNSRYPDGYKHSKEVKDMLRDRMKQHNPMFNTETKEKVKEKLFASYGGWFPTNNGIAYNKEACRIFEIINETFGWNGRHAENGGEIAVNGFYLDYYEPEKNLVIEYDEQHHRRKSRKRLDAIKDKVLRNTLNCTIVRIDYTLDTDKILEVLSTYA